METEVLSDSAANLLQVNGRLPGDKARMRAVIDEYLSMVPRKRIEYSLQSMLASFSGQYGGLSEEVSEVIRPVLKGSNLDFEGVPDEKP